MNEVRIHLGQVQIALDRNAIKHTQRQRDPMKPILSREAIPHDHAEIRRERHIERGAEREPSVREGLRQGLRNPRDRLGAIPKIPDGERRRGGNHVLRGGLGEVDVLETALPDHQRAVLEQSVELAGVVDLDLQAAAHLEVQLLSALEQRALGVMRDREGNGEDGGVAIAVDGLDELVFPEIDEREERLEADFGEKLLDAVRGLLEEVLRAQVGHHHRLLDALQGLPDAALDAHAAQQDQPVALRGVVLSGLHVVLVNIEPDFNVLGVLGQRVHLVVHAVIGKRTAQTGPNQRVGEGRSVQLAPHGVVGEVDQELVDRFALARERVHLGEAGDEKTRLVFIEGQTDRPVGRGLLVVVLDHPENHAMVELLDAALHAQLLADENGELVHDLHAPVRQFGVGQLDYELAGERVDREVHADGRGA